MQGQRRAKRANCEIENSCKLSLTLITNDNNEVLELAKQDEKRVNHEDFHLDTYQEQMAFVYSKRTNAQEKS